MALLAVAGVTVLAPEVGALPRMGLQAGSRCVNCHVNPQGGGLRSDLGWYSMNQVGAVTWDKLGLSGLHNIESNTWMDGKLLFGFDDRMQMAKLGPAPRYDKKTGSVIEPDRIFFPMQVAPGLAFLPMPSLTLSATANISGLLASYKDGLDDPKPKWTKNFRRYAGQSGYEAWALWQGEFTWPSVKVGVMQPSFGIRHDDHTMLLRRDARNLGQPTLPPYYADPGLEVSYTLDFEGEALSSHLTLDAGVFMARNFADFETRMNTAKYLLLLNGKTPESDVKAANQGTPIVTARATWFPQMLEHGLNGTVQASLFQAGDVAMHDVAIGIGKGYWGTLIAEYMHGMAPKRTISNWMVQLSYPAYDWLIPEARFESASTNDQHDDGTLKDWTATSAVVGVQFFPVPFLELRPEYRYLFASDAGAEDPAADLWHYATAQWTFQAHLFF
ncbi:MAG: hypothetical protein EXR79_05645 [Myxococcales bacterium]|nr:hypothetical protein [Myxococcales bacterium]